MYNIVPPSPVHSDLVGDDRPQPSYAVNGHGAAYRCSRDNGGLLAGWRVYDKPTIGKGGNWVHYEISPDMADDPDAVTKAFTDILNRIVAALEGNK